MATAPKQNTQGQRERFIEAAQAAGAKEDESKFEQRFKTVAGANSSKGASWKSEKGASWK